MFSWLTLASALALAQSEHSDTTLRELAKTADLIAVVQVEETEYRYNRGYAVEGSAYLRVRIPYKGTERGETIRVAEKGIGDTTCYYPELGPFELEGARFLVLLDKATDKGAGVYRGTAPGCKIPVLVTQDAGYAIAYPVPGLTLPEELAKPMDFADPAAYIDISDLSRGQLQTLQEQLELVPTKRDNIYIYARGIPLESARDLLSLEMPTEN